MSYACMTTGTLSASRILWTRSLGRKEVNPENEAEVKMRMMRVMETSFFLCGYDAGDGEVMDTDLWEGGSGSYLHTTLPTH